jgi:hypothetical protein
MAQRIITLCDVHARSDEDAAGTTWAVTLQGPDGKPTSWEIDLCEDDGKTLVDLAVMLNAVGRVTAGPKRRVAASERRQVREDQRSGLAAPKAPEAAPEWPCPLCDKAPISRSALASHLNRHHDGITVAEARGEPLPFDCPECDKAFSHPTGLGAHRRTIHGVQGAQRASA